MHMGIKGEVGEGICAHGKRGVGVGGMLYE